MYYLKIVIKYVFVYYVYTQQISAYHTEMFV